MKKYKFKSVLFTSQIVLLISILLLVNFVGFFLFTKEFDKKQNAYVEDGVFSLLKQNTEHLELALYSAELSAINTEIIDYLHYKNSLIDDKDIDSEIDKDMKSQVNLAFELMKKDYPFISDIEIIDNSSVVLYRTEDDNFGDKKTDALTQKALSGISSKGVSRLGEESKITLEGNAPVYSGENVIGIVKVEINIDNTLFNVIKENQEFDIGIMYNEDIMYFSNGDSDLDSLIVKSEEGKSLLNAEIYNDLIDKNIMHVEKVSLFGDDRYLTILKPLRSYDDKLLGMCIISYDLLEEKTIDQSILKSMTFMMIMVVIIAIILGYYTTGFLTKSIYVLKDKIRRIDENDNEIELSVDTKIEEVSELTLEFNNMIKRIIGHKLENEELEAVSNKDGLTGFWNHKFFYESLANAIVDNEYFSLLFLDIDKFKKINDKLGHKTGDKVLIQLSRLLCEKYPQFDYFRYGGEEFAIVMKDVNVMDAYKMAEDLRNYVEHSREIKELSKGIDVTISIGITTSKSGNMNLDEIISKADKAMYYGKYNGRNQSNIYDNEVELFFETQEADIIKRESIHTAVDSLISTLEEKDYYSGSHSKFVEKFSYALGKRIGLSLNSLDNLKMAASLHDIGKIGVPDNILKSSNNLSESEYVIAKEHAAIGFNISRHLFKDEEILRGIRNHHERWDGNGYPDALKEEKIPLFARIISIADSYHSMVYGSHYRDKKTKEEAINELVENSAKQFDPSLVDIFVDIINDNYIYNGVENDIEEIIISSNTESLSVPFGMYDVYDSTHYVMEIDKNYNIVFVNKAIADMLGVDAEELIGQKCYNSILGNNSSCSNCKVPEVIYEKSVKESTKIERRKSGELVTINQVFMPLFDIDGNVDHIMEFAYDKESKEPQKIKSVKKH